MASAIAEFLANSAALIGRSVEERKPWNQQASADSIRHFALGTSDPNPLWVDANHTRQTVHDGLIAPPLFVTSVRYPVLHGAATPLPLENWISQLRFRWFRQVHVGDRLTGTSQLASVELFDQREDRVQLCTRTVYCDERDRKVARAEVTLVRMLGSEVELRLNRECHRYSPVELRSIAEAVRSEFVRGAEKFELQDLQPGLPLPPIVRGPLSVADMVGWNAGVGPAMAAGAVGMRALLASSLPPLLHPLTGAPISASHQHEDMLLSGGRGMPLPFDNGVMRLAWLMPLITNWVGDMGVVRKIDARILRPNLYGDVTWYSGHIAACDASESGHRLEVSVRGVNQLGERTVEAECEVLVPRAAIRGLSNAPASQFGRTRTSNRVVRGESVCESTLFAKLAHHARQTPEKIALADDTERLTYFELEQRVTNAACALRTMMPTPSADWRVALLLPRSVEAIVAQLAVIRAGGTYVPLDSESPAQFIREGLLTVGVTHVLASSTQPADLPSGPWDVLYMPRGSSATDQQLPDVDDDHRIALVMFTSGSSGGPRGVEIPRLSLWRYLASLSQAFGPPDERQVYAHTASLAFSASTRQSYLPLWLGNTLYIASAEVRRDPLRVIRWLNHVGVTVWDTTPSVWAAALRAIDQLPPDKAPELSSLRRIMLTGELLEWKLPARWRKRFSNLQEIFNLYSQTETAGTVAVYRVPFGLIADQGAVPIGDPIGGVSLDIVNERLQPQETGAVGQLVVTSRQLARGYVRVSHDNSPFGNEDERGQPTTYRTGDMAVAAPDGAIKIVGRVDRRVKIRGFRVNLEDVERALKRHEHVMDAAVVIEPSGERESLTAAYAPIAGGQLTPAELRSYLRRSIPDYMIPARYVRLPAIPKTISGKTAYHELPATLATADLEPQGELRPEHRRMAEIWQEILQIPFVASDADFFTVGGDSLLATSLAIQVERQLGVEIAPEAIYQATRLDEFVELVKSRRETPEVRPLREADGPVLFCLPGRKGGSIYLRHVLPHLSGEFSVYCLQPAHDEFRDGTSRSFDEITQRFAEIVTRRRNKQGVYLMGYSFAGYLAYDVACKLVGQGVDVARLILLDTAGPGWSQQRSSVWQQIRKTVVLASHPTSVAARSYFQRKAERIRNSVRKRLTVARANAISSSQLRAKRLYTRAMQCHQFERFPGQIDLVQCTQGRLLRLEPPANGWLSWAEGGVQIHQVKATHASLLRPAHAPAVANVIEALIAPTSAIRAAA
jgi:amino acid adenylation domain-containing protein